MVEGRSILDQFWEELSEEKNAERENEEEQTQVLLCISCFV